MVGTRFPDTGVEGGVGLTALMVAAARAIETHRPDSLARDVYAEHFVRAARASAEWPVRPDDVPDGDANPLWGRLARYFGLRTRALDDFLVGCTHAGSTQVVLLAAGLDARAYRLDWPAGTVVHELDREGVLAFKHRVLNGIEAVPKAERKPIATDLREDWATDLVHAGFDPSAGQRKKPLVGRPPARREKRLALPEDGDRGPEDGSHGVEKIARNGRCQVRRAARH